MKSFPPEVKFQKPWRDYQARVLSELDEHLDDNKLHIIAPPGSGKTVLGLEVIRRLNKPALILSPTITIKNQWLDRFTALFLPSPNENPNWLSKDIKNLKFLTSATYQALHSAYYGAIEEEENGEDYEDEDAFEEKETLDKNNNKIDIIKVLKKAGIKTLVVDEAHHLRNEWWKSLIELESELEDITVVALTATPPYDVSPLEWERYKRLCGPVDAEISVPELVLKEDLCPHQDYIYFSYPSAEENARIKKFRDSVEKFRKEINANSTFIEALAAHPFLKEAEANTEKILEEPELASSIVIFLNHAGRKITGKTLNILGVKDKKIPALDTYWLETLLTFCFFKDEYLQDCAPVKEIKTFLSRIGAIERKKVLLKNNETINKLLASSITKLNSITDVALQEAQALGKDLRMVILTDFIRKAELPKNNQDLKPLNRIGVAPIFEAIRRLNYGAIKLGILSGSLVVIPEAVRELFNRITAEAGIKPEQVSFAELACDKNYLTVEIEGENRQKMVCLMTKLFSEGAITVLVGTKALLGEGWDAPCINSLILASFVGSYMLSNQMRGRAIRVLATDPDKTSNIWHLVCVEKDSQTPGEDLATLSRRFKAFVGVSFKEPVIENGIDRLNTGSAPFSKDKVDAINNAMANASSDRAGLKQSWENALQKGKKGVRMVEEVEIPKIKLTQGFIFSNTVTALLWEGLSSAVIIFIYALNFAGDLTSFLKLMLIAAILSAVVSLPYFIKALWMFLRYGPVESAARQIAEALFKTLYHFHFIKTDISKLYIKTEKDRYGGIYCSLIGTASYEKSLYLDALQEILDPIENPRYLISRKSFWGLIKRADFHALPDIIGRNKEYAEYFEKMWKKYVCPSELIYTRTPEGRKTLLQARMKSHSAAFRKRTNRINCWK